MGIFSKRKRVKELQDQLANVNRQLDAVERRASDQPNQILAQRVAESPEIRFAACVASGMSKMQTSAKVELES